MILTSLNAVVYRVHQPKWAFAPTSGAGAGTYGGRANRPGVNALYLSLELETALAEYQQLDALLPPGLMVSYNLSIDSIVDFRGGFTSDWDALWQHFYCDWRNMHFNQGIDPHPGSSATKSSLPAQKESCSGPRSSAARILLSTLMR
jgi:RES domain-containing protein